MSDLNCAGALYGAMVGLFFLAGAAFIRTKPAWLGGFFVLLAIVAWFWGWAKDKQVEAAIRGARDPREVADVLGDPGDREPAQ